jgi:hypothetical protein
MFQNEARFVRTGLAERFMEADGMMVYLEPEVFEE